MGTNSYGSNNDFMTYDRLFNCFPYSFVIKLSNFMIKFNYYFVVTFTIFPPSPRYTKYTITSLEKTYKPKLFVEPDLGIPLDLLDLSVYKYHTQP